MRDFLKTVEGKIGRVSEGHPEAGSPGGWRAIDKKKAG